MVGVIGHPCMQRAETIRSFFIMAYKDTLCTNFIMRKKERLAYGDKDRGRFVESEKGRRAIFVPSFGTMEREEIDDIVLAAQGQEDERIKKGEKTQLKENIENLTQAALSAPKGQRAKIVREILKEE